MWETASRLPICPGRFIDSPYHFFFLLLSFEFTHPHTFIHSAWQLMVSAAQSREAAIAAASSHPSSPSFTSCSSFGRETRQLSLSHTHSMGAGEEICSSSSTNSKKLLSPSFFVQHFWRHIWKLVPLHKEGEENFNTHPHPTRLNTRIVRPFGDCCVSPSSSLSLSLSLSLSFSLSLSLSLSSPIVCAYTL